MPRMLTCVHRYDQEMFSVRRKDFWPLWYSRRLMQEKMSAMEDAHGTDGLILQGFDDFYKPGGGRRLGPGPWPIAAVGMSC